MKSFAVVETEEIAIGRKYSFTSVNVCFALVFPSWTLPKFWLVGLSLSADSFGLFRWNPQPVAKARMQVRNSTAKDDRGPGADGPFVAATSAPQGTTSKARVSLRSMRPPPCCQLRSNNFRNGDCTVDPKTLHEPFYLFRCPVSSTRENGISGSCRLETKQNLDRRERSLSKDSCRAVLPPCALSRNDGTNRLLLDLFVYCQHEKVILLITKH